MNAVKFFITLAVLVACVMAAEQEPAREKRFPLAYSGLYHGGLGGIGYGGYSAYGAYPYSAGYSAGYSGLHHYSPVSYGSYGGYGASAYHYPSYGYHAAHAYPSYGAHSLYHY